MRCLALAALLILPLAGHASAQASGLPEACIAANPTKAEGAHGGMAHGTHEPSVTPMAQMHEDMATAAAIPDPDLAFNCGMIAHHQGAIAMAETELKAGKDAVSRRLAETIIAAQRREIAEMTAWIAQHGS